MFKKTWDAAVAYTASNPEKAIVIALVINVLSIILTLTFDIWFPVVAAAGIGVFCVYDWYKTRQQQQRALQNRQEAANMEQRLDIVRQALCSATNALVHRLSSIFARVDIEELCIQFVILCGIGMFQCTIPHLPGANLDTGKVKRYLQARLNAELRAGRVPGLVGVSWDGRFPLLVIDRVEDRGTYYDVFVIFVDNRAAVDYLKRRQSEQEDTPTPVHSPVDSEF